MWAYRETMTTKSQEERLQNETFLGSALILDFPDSSTVRNNFLLFVNYHRCGILLWQREQISMGVCGPGGGESGEKMGLGVGGRWPRTAVFRKRLRLVACGHLLSRTYFRQIRYCPAVSLVKFTKWSSTFSKETIMSNLENNYKFPHIKGAP